MITAQKESLDVRYLELHNIYKHTPKAGVLIDIEEKILSGNYAAAEELMKMLPNKEQLVRNLARHLEGKPVEKTFKKALNNELKNKYELLKGLFSLGAHVCIELEHGKMEYGILLDDVMSNIYRVR